jgi:hypothetical protein
MAASGCKKQMSKQRIYKAISEAIKDIGPVAKGRRNPEQNFQYRGVDDVMNEMQPILAKHGIFIVPEVLEHTREERQAKSGRNLNYSIQKIAFHFVADDGSQVTAVVVGEGMDSGDKASNKALSIAFKYACLQVFCIPTEDMKDPDNETPPPRTPNPPAPKTNPNAARRKEVGDKLISIMVAKDPDEFDYFTDQEKKSVKDILVKSGPNRQGIAVLEGLIDKYGEELQKRMADMNSGS